MAGTPLLARPEWLPAAPVPLAAVALSWQPGRHGTVVDPVQPEGSAGVRPLRDDGTRFTSYADALAALSRPRLLENRTCYRLLAAAAAATGAAGGQFTFGVNRYFDLINVSEAVAHETAARVLARRGAESGSPDGMAAPAAAAPLSLAELPLRSRIGDPLDLARRSVTTGIATLILRLDRATGTGADVPALAGSGQRGGQRRAVPGRARPACSSRRTRPAWNLANDLGLWEAIAREVSEELLGTSEDYGSGAAPIDYPRWPFFAALAGARRAGTLRGYWLGVGADPLTLDVDLLTVLVFDAPFFDAEFGGLVAANDEGPLLAGPAGRAMAPVSISAPRTWPVSPVPRPCSRPGGAAPPGLAASRGTAGRLSESPRPGPVGQYGSMANRLKDATSPYLLQHADNPVDWWPWSDEAFGEARRRDVPVLLSVGYAACHWCHVMAHESFEDPATAALMNEHLVAIKVDREERPDVDAVYMTATQAMTGQGGWPMTVFMTPDRGPFYCGTYFPRPQFRQLILGVSSAWRTDRGGVEEQAGQVAEALAGNVAATARALREGGPDVLAGPDGGAPGPAGPGQPGAPDRRGRHRPGR